VFGCHSIGALKVSVSIGDGVISSDTFIVNTSKPLSAMVSNSTDESSLSSDGCGHDTRQHSGSHNQRRSHGNVHNRRRFLKTAGAGAVVLGTAGCLSRLGGSGGGNGEIGDTIKIGVLAPAPSKNPIGASIANSAKLAAEQLNKKNGIAGANVETIVKDTKENPSVGQSKFRELAIGEKVDMVTGVFTSEVLLNIMDDIAKQKTLTMSSGAATPQATRTVDENYEKYKYYFRTGPFNAHYLGANMIDFGVAAFEDMGWNKIAVLVEDYKWTSPITDVFKKQASKLPADIMTSLRYASGTKNFSPIYDKISGNNVDGVFVAMAHTGTSAVIQWAKQQRPFGFGGIHVPMQLPSYYGSVKGACRYGFTQNVATPQSKITKKTFPYANAYKKQFGGYPVYTGYITFDAIKQFTTVVEKKQTLATDQLISGLESGSYTGTAGTIEYYSKDHKYTHDLIYKRKAKTPVYMQWQKQKDGGIQQVFFPDSLQTGTYKHPAWLR
jgi:branched-chain amino acid transport system substrate-binding protein